MSRLDKRIKDVLLIKMSELDGVITTEAVMELIRPYYIFDVEKSREREIRKKANRLMSFFRDENGVRTCFSFKDDDGKSKYINIDESLDLKALDRVEKQINQKYFGLNASKKKIEKRKTEVFEQITFEDMSL